LRWSILIWSNRDVKTEESHEKENEEHREKMKGSVAQRQNAK